MRLYFRCKNLRALPDLGAIQDQRADTLAYFDAFSQAEAEHFRPKD